MQNHPPFAKRDGSHHHPPMPSTHTLMLVLAVLIFIALGLVAFLYFLPRWKAARRNRQQDLPTHYPQHTLHPPPPTCDAAWSSKSRSIHVHNEKRNLIQNSSAPPDTTPPEIRLTLPDEGEQRNHSRSSRVLLVRISDHGSVGMEPLLQEDLPPYRANGTEKLESIDLDRNTDSKAPPQPQRWV